MKLKNGFHGQMSDKFRAAVFIILSGGFQDAYTYCCRGSVFANAQTGNIVLMSTALVDADRSRVIKYLIPVVSFIIGIAIAEVVHMRFKNCEKIHWRQLILIDEIVLLFAVGFMPQKLDPLANALVSFVCALTYFAVILVFAVGAGVGSFVTGRLGEKSIWISCGLLLISFGMMFIREEEELILSAENGAKHSEN